MLEEGFLDQFMGKSCWPNHAQRKGLRCPFKKTHFEVKPARTPRAMMAGVRTDQASPADRMFAIDDGPGVGFFLMIWFQIGAGKPTKALLTASLSGRWAGKAIRRRATSDPGTGEKRTRRISVV
jgi:hypothetical protein